jgi:hypothetical protein
MCGISQFMILTGHGLSLFSYNVKRDDEVRLAGQRKSALEAEAPEQAASLQPGASCP